MRTDARHARRRGQAAIEFAIAMLVFIVIFSALTQFPKLMLTQLKMASDVRAEAGLNAISSVPGSYATSAAAPITALTGADSGGATRDRWLYPTALLPEEQNFARWRANAFNAADLIPAFRAKSFRLRLFWGRETILDDYGKIREETYFPPLGGMKTTGPEL